MTIVIMFGCRFFFSEMTNVQMVDVSLEGDKVWSIQNIMWKEYENWHLTNQFSTFHKVTIKESMKKRNTLQATSWATSNNSFSQFVYDKPRVCILSWCHGMSQKYDLKIPLIVISITAMNHFIYKIHTHTLYDRQMKQNFVLLRDIEIVFR